MHAASPVLRDIVLVGGGHSHVVVLRMFTMRPLPGVRLTLICTDTDTPYSGMLPGYIAGHYSFDEVHIDLRRLAESAGARYYRDEVIGIDFSGGLAGMISQLNAKFGGRMQFSNPAGMTLRVLDDGAGNLANVNALSMTRTATALSGGGLALPFFTDGNTTYSGAITAGGPQSLGFAGRIAVNPALVGDPSKLVLYNSGIAAGDASRPNYIYDRLVNGAQSFSSATGLGTAATPFIGGVPSFLRQVLSRQGSTADNAMRLAEGQAVVVSNLKQRVSDQSGVNVDQEMANLVALQTAYGASARVMSVIKDMLDMLMRM